MLTKVCADNGFQARLIEGAKNIGRGVVRQMAIWAADALPERWRVCRFGKHVAIMITFQHQCITSAQGRDQMRRGLARVGQYAEPYMAIIRNVLNRFARVMRHSVWRKLQISDGKAVAVTAKMNRYSVAILLHRLIRTKAEPHRDAMAPREFEHAANMILMLMSDYDTRHILRLDTQPLQAPFRFTDSESTVEHDGGAGHVGGCRDKQCIPLTAAPKACKFQCDLFELFV